MLVDCKNCSKQINRSPSHIGKECFCSKTCYSQFHTSKVECNFCGTIFHKTKTEIEKTDRNYCSKSCAASGNNQLFPKRKSILDNSIKVLDTRIRACLRQFVQRTKCVHCGYKKHTEFCHVIPRHSAKSKEDLLKLHQPSNLIELCRNCHWEQEYLGLDVSGYSTIQNNDGIDQYLSVLNNY